MSASGSVDTGNQRITDEFSVNPTLEDTEKPPKKRVTIVSPTGNDPIAKFKRKSTAVLAATRMSLALKKKEKE